MKYSLRNVKVPHFFYEKNPPVRKEEKVRSVIEEHPEPPVDVSLITERSKTSPLPKPTGRHPNYLVWEGRNLCSTCGESDVCGLADPRKTRCGLYKPDDQDCI